MRLSCQNVSKSFGGVRALDNVTIEFPETGCIAIIGPNGAGKSTLLDVITGLVRPGQGACLLDGRDITHLRSYQIARLGIGRTFQQVRLVGRLSVLDNVMLARPGQRGERFLNALFGSRARADEAAGKGQARELLNSVGLIDEWAAPACDLSYGQQKLLSICCCLAMDAGIILLDEPVAGVHPDLVELISDYLKGIATAGRLVVFVEHNIGMVQRTADLVMVMNAGRVVASGPPADVLTRADLLEAYVA
jgi:ABC-type branched-subunit amino acid transport system ATPase component